MQLSPSGGQIWNQCNWRHRVAKFVINASGAIWWPNLELMQVVPSGDQIWNLCKWCHLVTKFATNSSSATEIDLIYSSWKIYSSYEINTLGPLCLWQCFVKASQKAVLQFLWCILYINHILPILNETLKLIHCEKWLLVLRLTSSFSKTTILLMPQTQFLNKRFCLGHHRPDQLGKAE